MGNIVKFPKAKRVTFRAGTEAVKARLANVDVKDKVFPALWIMLQFVRVPLFLVLFWLRLPLRLIGNIAVAGGLVAFALAWFVAPVPRMLWGFGLLSFFAFVVMWAYDFLLMALSPQDMVQSI